MEVMELPYAFRSTITTLPRIIPYVQLPRPALAAAKARMSNGDSKRIGLVWAGGEWNRSRSIPFQLLQPLLQETPAIFYSLQGGEDNADWAEMRDSYHSRDGQNSPSGLRYHDTADHGPGLIPLAAAIANLDLVITVDTMAAHLAGALGIPVWLLLQHAADWRWMIHRTDSPWYPRMRIFRQPAPGNWPAVIAEVCHELKSR